LEGSGQALTPFSTSRYDDFSGFFHRFFLVEIHKPLAGCGLGKSQL
jgi:hypothetical protein